MMPQHRYEAGLPLTEEEKQTLENSGLLVKEQNEQRIFNLKEVELEPLQRV